MSRVTARHARVNPQAPEAWGSCDRCGFTYNLVNLRYQFEFEGTGLMNTHLRVCPKCIDVPNENFRAVSIPPDPRPVVDPRPLPTVDLTIGEDE